MSNDSFWNVPILFAFFKLPKSTCPPAAIKTRIKTLKSDRSAKLAYTCFVLIDYKFYIFTSIYPRHLQKNATGDVFKATVKQFIYPDFTLN